MPPFKYSVLTDAQQAEIVRTHLLQAEADHFAATLNAEKAEAAAKADPESGFAKAAEEYRASAKRIEGDITALKKRAP